MSKYINKDAIVAEIKRLISIANSQYDLVGNEDIRNRILWSQQASVCSQILSFLDTLEVKEVDLENSIVCKVGWYDGFFLDYTQEQQDALLEKIGANVGDKVMVILIKE